MMQHPLCTFGWARHVVSSNSGARNFKHLSRGAPAALHSRVATVHVELES